MSSPDGPTPGSGIGITVAVLGFAIAFPLVAKLSNLDVAVVTATLASLPGILYAALGRPYY